MLLRRSLWFLRAGFYKHVAPLALGTERGRSLTRYASPDQKALVEPQTDLPVHALRRQPEGRDTVVRGMRVRGMTLYRNASDSIPLPMIPLTELAVFNTTGRADWPRQKPMKAVGVGKSPSGLTYL